MQLHMIVGNVILVYTSILNDSILRAGKLFLLKKFNTKLCLLM